MPRMTLFDAQDVTFLDLIGNGKRFYVPAYQRDYSWPEEYWEDLWNDVIEIYQKSESYHYMGAIVLESKSDREFMIIDGQQRIVTLSILILAIIKRIEDIAKSGIKKENNLERASILRKFIGEKDPKSLLHQSKLTLNIVDNDAYRDFLVQGKIPSNPKKLPKSNQLLLQSYDYFYKKIEDSEIGNSGEKMSSFVDDIISSKLLFIRIVIDDDQNAYTVFETLNARGLALTSTDLLKNYFFSRVDSKSDQESLNRQWQRLLLTVRQEKFPEFLRFHLLTEHSVIRQQKLFKLVRSTVKDAGQVFSLIESLEPEAELFSALSDPYHNYWISDKDAMMVIRSLTLFRVRQVYPLLFAAYPKLRPQEFTRLLKMIEVISFRFTIIAERNPQDLESNYARAAKEVREGRATTCKEIFALLQNIYVTDEVFRQLFETKEMKTSGPSKKIVRYILSKLEADAGNESDFETDPATIEHVYPESMPEKWSANFDTDTAIHHLFRLGNLTYLELSKNKEIGDSEFDIKKAAYFSSKYVGARQIAEDFGIWDPSAIRKRQEKMARRAVTIWRQDF